jgi:hypothetical protein
LEEHEARVAARLPDMLAPIAHLVVDFIAPVFLGISKRVERRDELTFFELGQITVTRSRYFRTNPPTLSCMCFAPNVFKRTSGRELLWIVDPPSDDDHIVNPPADVDHDDFLTTTRHSSSNYTRLELIDADENPVDREKKCIALVPATTALFPAALSLCPLDGSYALRVFLQKPGHPTRDRCWPAATFSRSDWSTISAMCWVPVVKGGGGLLYMFEQHVEKNNKPSWWSLRLRWLVFDGAKWTNTEQDQINVPRFARSCNLLRVCNNQHTGDKLLVAYCENCLLTLRLDTDTARPLDDWRTTFNAPPGTIIFPSSDPRVLAFQDGGDIYLSRTRIWQ